MPIYRDARTKRARYEQLKAALETERSTFLAHWRDLGDHFQPRRTRFWPGDRNRGDKRNQNIINSTGRFAARTLSSGLHAGLTSPARPWLKLTTPDRELAEFGAVKAWLHVVTQRMLTVFAVSNLYNALPIVYGDMGVFGTAAMAVLADTRDTFRTVAYPIGSYMLGQDNRGRTSVFVREYQMTVRQIVEEFGLENDGTTINWSNLSTLVKTAWDRGDYETAIDVTWIVQPNEEADRNRLEAKYLPWSSCHFEGAAAENKFLRESGFGQFPVLAPRWDITGEDTYGTDCPGMTALGDTRQLQMMERKKGQAIAKMVDPPVMGPSALRNQKTSLLPGDITYVDVREGMQGLRPVHEVRLDLSHLKEDINAVEYRIQRSFYEDLFLMLATSDNLRGAQPITAREVEERHEEKLLALGPVLERTNDELLDPLVDRVWELMIQRDLLPEPPPELRGVNLQPEYISILSQAQKLVGVASLDRFMFSMQPLAEAYPEVRAKIVINQVIDNYADMLGVDPRIVRASEEADQIIAAQQQAAQAQADAEQAQRMGAGMKSAADAKFAGGDSVLDRIVSNAGAPA